VTSCPGSRIPVDRLLQVAQEVGGVLDLVDDGTRLVRREEAAGIETRERAVVQRFKRHVGQKRQGGLAERRLP